MLNLLFKKKKYIYRPKKKKKIIFDPVSYYLLPDVMNKVVLVSVICQPTFVWIQSIISNLSALQTEDLGTNFRG